MYQENERGALSAVFSRCSNGPLSKAAASEGPEAYPLGYVEGLNDARTPLAAIFNSLLQFLHDPLDIAGQFHVTLAVNRFSLRRAGGLDGAFPVGDLRATFGGEFLLCHTGHEFQ